MLLAAVLTSDILPSASFVPRLKKKHENQSYTTLPPCMPADPAAFEVPLESRKRQADAIRHYWAAAPLLPRVAAAKKRVMYIT